MATNSEEKNKKLVLEAFDTLFNKRDYKAAEKYWSSNYVQHSPHIQPGRDGLFNLIRGTPASLRYEPGLILANDDHVIVHGRFSNIGLPKNWIAADIVRIAGGVLVEHWDVLQDEATRAESQSGQLRAPPNLSSHRLRWQAEYAHERPPHSNTSKQAPLRPKISDNFHQIWARGSLQSYQE